MVDNPGNTGPGDDGADDEELLDRVDERDLGDSDEPTDTENQLREEAAQQSLARLKPLHNAIGNVLAINSFTSVLQGFREERIVLLQDLEANKATDLEFIEQIDLIHKAVKEQQVAAIAALADDADSTAQNEKQLRQSLQRLDDHFEAIKEQAIEDLPEETKEFLENGPSAPKKKKQKVEIPKTRTLDHDKYLKKIGLAFKSEAELLTNNVVIPGIKEISKDIDQKRPERTPAEQRFWKPDVPTKAELEFDRIKSNIEGWPERVARELSRSANLENDQTPQDESDITAGISSTQVMPADRRGIAHRIAWTYSAIYRVATHPATIVGPMLFAFKKPDGPNKGEPDLSHDRAWIDRHIPVHFRARSYVAPVIRKADELLEESGLIQPILEMNSKMGQNGIVSQNGNLMHAGTLQTLHERLSNNMVKPEQAVREAVRHVQEFVKQNGAKFDEFAVKLDSLILEVSARKPAVPGKYGLEVKQLKAMKEWLRGIKQIATDIGGDGAFARNYEARIQETLAEVKSGKKKSSDLADAIINQFQKVTEIGHEAQVRNTDKDVDHFNLWRYVRAVVVRAGPRVYALENTRSRERKIIEGHYNPHIRTAAITAENFNPNTPDNTENFVINIETYHDWKNNPEKTQGEDPEKKLASYVVACYEVGFEHEGIYALRNLLWRAGRAGKPLPVASILKYVEESKPKNAGDHWDKFITDMRGTITNLPHSGLIFDQRHVLEGYVKWTMNARQSRKFPGRREMSTPGRQSFFIEPRERFLKAFNNYLLPLREDTDSTLKKDEKGKLLNADGTQAKFFQRVGLRLKDMGAGVVGFGLRLLRNWGLIWVLPGIKVTEATAKFAWNHQALRYFVRPTFKVGVVAAGLTIAGTGVVSGAREGSVMKGVQSIAANTIDTVSAVGDVALAPARLNANIFKYATYPIPGIGGGSIWGTGNWGIGPVSKWMGWDYMSKGIQPHMVTTDWNLGFLADVVSGDAFKSSNTPDAATPSGGTGPDAGSGSQDKPAQPQQTPEQVRNTILTAFITAIGDDLNGDGKANGADQDLKDRFMRMMQTHAVDVDAIGKIADPAIRSAMLHDLYNQITNSDFDGVGNAQDGDISQHWKRALGLTAPPPSPDPVTTTTKAPAQKSLTVDVQMRDFNGDGQINLDDLTAKEVLEKAAKILADTSIQFNMGDIDGNGITNLEDLAALEKIKESQKIIQGLTGAFHGDLNNDGKIDQMDVARAKEIIRAHESMKKKDPAKTVEKGGAEPSGPG